MSQKVERRVVALMMSSHQHLEFVEVISKVKQTAAGPIGHFPDIERDARDAFRC
jgi:hypothetical protein